MINKSLLRGVKAKMAGSATILLLAMGVMGSQQALAGISATKHNLGSTGTGANKFSGTGEICVFCHTPHGADVSASMPLWNRSLASAPTYTTYNSLGTSSLDGATVAVGSVSIACLSCHDGTQAMNTMINAPGSGLGGDAAWVAGAWTGPALAAGGKIGSGVTNLTADLRNDHPIGIQYGGGMPGVGGAFTAGTIADGAFKDADFIYAKNWSSYTDYGKILSQDPAWKITMEKMALTNNAKFMHCLPVRRNIVVEDAVLDSPNSVVVRQAGNRIWSAQVVLKHILMKIIREESPYLF